MKSLQSFLTKQRVRVEVHPHDKANARRTRIVHVASDGKETDISGVCKRAVMTLDVDAVPEVEITCNAELAGEGEMFISAASELPGPRAAKLANVLPPEAQRDVAKRLRKLAEEIEGGDVRVTDLYASINAFDTTPDGATAQTCAIDPTSFVLMLRFARPSGK